MENPNTPQLKKFDTFGGVFTPTLLTILGVIMYLRLGWVVGNAGLLGAWVIILVSFVITTCTALSMSSIVTNIKIGTGGAYAIISQALGLEVGGSLGIPRYLSQALAVTMYIFGFREGWLMIFPSHPSFAIDLAVFLLLFAIAYKSADLAIKTQFIIMGVIIISLASIVFSAYFYGAQYKSPDEIIKWGSFMGSPENGFQGIDFWVVFAVFFPASTGIMAGANMSGELKDPRESIPKGTLWAIGISFVIYMLLAFWIASAATEAELVGNYNIMIEKAIWPPLIIAGLLGATFSSALASIIGSSRILFAMGQHHVLPKSKWLAVQNKTGQPVNTMIVTGILIFLSILIRDLNAIAPIVTLFFLITYAMLNVIVIIEQNLGLISFRPTFKVNKIIPWFGLISSVLAMFIINPTLSLISVSVVLAVYWILSRRNLQTQFEDVRSGIFSAFAEWAAKQTAGLDFRQERAWKPNLLVPSTDAAIIQGNFDILKDIAHPTGSASLMGIGTGTKAKKLKAAIMKISNAFQKDQVFSSWTMMRTESFARGVNLGNQALRGAFFKPNIVFLSLSESTDVKTNFKAVIEESAKLELGVLLYAKHPTASLGLKQNVNIWVSDRSPEWNIEGGIGNLNLTILVAYKLQLNWNASVKMITVVKDEETKSKAEIFMEELVNRARLPEIGTKVYVGDFAQRIKEAPDADLNIFGLSPKMEIKTLEEMAAKLNTSCMFIQDSGVENVLA